MPSFQWVKYVPLSRNILQTCFKCRVYFMASLPTPSPILRSTPYSNNHRTSATRSKPLMLVKAKGGVPRARTPGAFPKDLMPVPMLRVFHYANTAIMTITKECIMHGHTVSNVGTVLNNDLSTGFTCSKLQHSFRNGLRVLGRKPTKKCWIMMCNDLPKYS